MQYELFLEQRRARFERASVGVNKAPGELRKELFPFQRDIVAWALQKGRAAIFAGTGLGKTFMQLEWADVIRSHTGGDVLIITPLAVARQTAAESERFGIHARVCRDGAHGAGITITNYESLHKFDASNYVGVVLDESSILKHFDSSTRNLLIDKFKNTPYRLACTATPAPNDFTEIGNHAEFLGVMTRVEMLAMFFIHDGGDTSKWRLKGHGEDAFWMWMSSWGVMIQRPEDIGHDGAAFVLPPLNIENVVVDHRVSAPGTLFAAEASTLSERRVARRESTSDRADAAAELINKSGDQWVVWCDLNAEAEAITDRIPGAVEVRGTMSHEDKEAAAAAFADGSIRVIVTKPSIFGMGLNWQHCHKMAFVGLSDSWEAFYQSVRRCWRFGQHSPVDVYIISSSAEGAVLRNIQRKSNDADRMMAELRRYSMHAVRGVSAMRTAYRTEQTITDKWTMFLGDSTERLREIPDASIGYSIFSPPFASLYVYSDSERDMGNCASHAEFGEHYRYIALELARVMMPGRVVSVHCMNLPTSKQNDGYIGLRDFRGDLIRIMQSAGFIYHSEVCIWKDPVTAMQRTKSIGLLYKQLRKDGTISRQGIPDYLVSFRTPGVNADPVTHTHEGFPVERWQQYASPIWMDINQSRTLQYRCAREGSDERHICPLQLDVIERGLELWSNPGDLVLSPFAGIGSEGWCAVKMGRKFLGIELKKSYYDIAIKNLREADGSTSAQIQLL